MAKQSSFSYLWTDRNVSSLNWVTSAHEAFLYWDVSVWFCTQFVETFVACLFTIYGPTWLKLMMIIFSHRKARVEWLSIMRIVLRVRVQINSSKKKKQINWMKRVLLSSTRKSESFSIRLKQQQTSQGETKLSYKLFPSFLLSLTRLFNVVEVYLFHRRTFNIKCFAFSFNTFPWFIYSYHQRTLKELCWHC